MAECPRNRPRAAANAQYGAASRRRAAVPARSTAHPRGDVRQLRGGERIRLCSYRVKFLVSLK